MDGTAPHHGTNEIFSYLTLFMSIFGLLSSGIGIILFWKRRNIFPLSGRAVVLDMMWNGFSFTSRFIIILRFILPYGRPCWLTHWDSLIDLTGLALLMVMRGWQLLFKGEVARSIKAKETSWYLKNRHLISTKWLLKVTAGYYFIVICFGLVLSLGDPASNAGNDPCEDGIYGWFGSALIIVDCLVVCILACKIRNNENDNYKITWELKTAGILSIVGLVLWQLESAILSPADVEHYVVNDFDNCVILVINIVFVTIIPIATSYNDVSYVPKTPRKKVGENESSKSSGERYQLNGLEDLLSTPAGYKAFFGFLSKEWSTENLLFWKEVNDYKVDADPEHRKAKALEICEKYIQENGLYQVNLPATTRKAVQENIKLIGTEGASATLFDKAQEEIFHLMSTDSYYRFAQQVESNEIEISSLQRSPEASRNGTSRNSTNTNHSRVGSTIVVNDQRDLNVTSSTVQSDLGVTSSSIQEDLDRKSLQKSPFDDGERKSDVLPKSPSALQDFVNPLTGFSDDAISPTSPDEDDDDARREESVTEP